MLAPESRDFWDSRQKQIASGVIHCGRWERFFSRATSLVRSAGRVDRLIGCGTVEEQSRVWLREWDLPIVRAAVSFACSRPAARWILRDDAFHRFLPRDLDAGTWIMDRLADASRRQLFSESPFARILFEGALAADGPLPAHLRAEGLAAISAIDIPIRIVAQDLVDHLRRCPDSSYDAFSLSDVGSYLSPERYNALWREIARTASSGARICERRFLATHSIDPEVGRAMTRDPALERALEGDDASFFYSFVAAVKR